MFEIATQIATPLSLGALAILVFFYLLKIVFEKLDIARVIGVHTYKILMRSITFIFIIALIGLVLGVVSFFGVRFFDVKQAQKLDNAIADLGNSNPLVRTGAVDQLVSLGKTSSVDATRICSSLTSLVRSVSAGTLNMTHSYLSDDVQQAIRGLSYFIDSGRCRNVNLSGSDLRRIQLNEGNLSGSLLINSRLDQAALIGVNFSEANLNGSNLTEAVLRNANFTKASLSQVFWRKVDLRNANLSFASGLAGADLSTTKMDGAITEGVDLRDTKMPEQAAR